MRYDAKYTRPLVNIGGWRWSARQGKARHGTERSLDPFGPFSSIEQPKFRDCARCLLTFIRPNALQPLALLRLLLSIVKSLVSFFFFFSVSLTVLLLARLPCKFFLSRLPFWLTKLIKKTHENRQERRAYFSEAPGVGRGPFPFLPSLCALTSSTVLYSARLDYSLLVGRNFMPLNPFGLDASEYITEFVVGLLLLRNYCTAHSNNKHAASQWKTKKKKNRVPIAKTKQNQIPDLSVLWPFWLNLNRTKP